MKNHRRVIAQAIYLTLTFVFGFMLFNTNRHGRVVLQNDSKTETLIVYNDTGKTSKPDVIEVKKEEKAVEQPEQQEENTQEVAEEESVIEEVSAPVDPIVYEGMTLNELAAKLDRSLSSTLSGYGYTFASKSIELGIDPYLAVGIVLHETGCSWDCSNLVKSCNNVGGMKGAPGCGGGSYKAFATLDEGINSYMNNLYNNYYAYGLDTPETIGPKYAASTTWSSQVRWYIEKLRAA